MVFSLRFWRYAGNDVPCVLFNITYLVRRVNFNFSLVEEKQIFIKEKASDIFSLYEVNCRHMQK